MIDPTSTLKRPPDKLVAHFRLSQIGGDTIADYLSKGLSLAICCKACPRLVEWTPPDLAPRFGARPDLPIADIAARLTCSGRDGCGATDIAVFPHLYDGRWTWRTGGAR